MVMTLDSYLALVLLLLVLLLVRRWWVVGLMRFRSHDLPGSPEERRKTVETLFTAFVIGMLTVASMIYLLGILRLFGD
jgi:hypothetical protein